MDKTLNQTYNITEIFKSIQGEGRLAGVVSVFVRLAGCHLRCRWCDSSHSWDYDAGKAMTIKEIVDEVESYNCDFVVVTGGEPLVNKKLGVLLENLRGDGRHITIETAGTIYQEIKADLISISPKLSSSTPGGQFRDQHESERINIKAIEQFIGNYDYQLKFVVGNENDMYETKELLAMLPCMPRDKVMLMPQAANQEEYRRLAPQIAQWCIENNFSFCPRLHIEFWDRQARK